eukprot:gene14894-6033_t
MKHRSTPSRSLAAIINASEVYEAMAGIARVKEQFVVTKTEKISTEFIKKGSYEENVEVPSEEQNYSVGESESSAPKREKRKKKERGQNKKRPRTVPKQAPNERLCPSLSRGNYSCANQKDCKFLHDVDEYLRKKPDDIGECCVNFQLNGRCKFGLECRFAKCHISDDFKNIVDEEKYEKSQSKAEEARMARSKDLQIRLRKKQYDFPKSDTFLGNLSVDTHPKVETDKRVAYADEGRLGCCTNEDIIKQNVRERKQVDFSNKLYLAPLTTGQQSEWALIKRHESEDLFGVQLCGSFPDTMTRCAEMLSSEMDVDFIDVNIGCPIDLVFKKGGGCALMGRQKKFQNIVKGMVEVSSVPITVKMRNGIYDKNWTAHEIIPKIRDWGASLITLHGRSREQRYTRLADWEYINECASAASPMPLYGNGDILSFEDANLRRENTGVAGIMIARHWDISATERLDILRRYTNYGLEHWGSDTKGVENTRRFLLEWLSFLHRKASVVEVLEQVNNFDTKKASPIGSIPAKIIKDDVELPPPARPLQ